MAAKLTRKNMKVFGSAPGVNQMAVFGSLKAGAPAFSTNVETIQSLSNYLTGWFDAVIGGSAPAIEDWNSLCFVFAYQIAYLMQTGVEEWNASTEYFIGSIANDGTGQLYVSIVDNNLNNALTDSTKWKIQGNGVRNVTGTDTAVQTDEYLRLDPTGASFVETLPSLAATPLGKEFTLKNVATNGNTATVTPDGSDTIDQQASVVLNSIPIQDCITVKNGGPQWDLV